MTEADDACTPTPVGGKFLKALTVHRDDLAAAIKHNHRHQLADHPCPKDGRPERTPLNVVLAGISHPDEAEAFIAAHKACVTLPTRANATTAAVEFVLSTPPRMKNPGECLRAFVAWVEAHTGMPLISAVEHADQGPPHCHVLMLPILDGKWVGSRAIDKDRLKALQAAFDKEVGRRFGLTKKRPSREARQQAHSYVIERITSDPQALLACFAAIDAAAARDPESFLACWGESMGRFEAKATITALFTREVGGDREQEQRILRSSGIASRAASGADESAIAEPETAIAVRESAIAGASGNLLHRDSTLAAPPPRPLISPPPRPVLSLVPSPPRPDPTTAPPPPAFLSAVQPTPQRQTMPDNSWQDNPPAHVRTPEQLAKWIRNRKERERLKRRAKARTSQHHGEAVSATA